VLSRLCGNSGDQNKEGKISGHVACMGEKKNTHRILAWKCKRWTAWKAQAQMMG
jgi:hypothetical protein